MRISEMVGGTVQKVSKVHGIPVGARLAKVRRAVFVLGSDLSGNIGDLELSFDNGQVFSLGVAGDGESLAIEPNLWPIQFPDPVSTENQEFLWVSGKWEILDVGEGLWSYRQFIGRRLCSTETLDSNGLLLDFEGMLIRVEVIADETHLHFARSANLA
jgi:hypothetical protein